MRTRGPSSSSGRGRLVSFRVAGARGTAKTTALALSLSQVAEVLRPSPTFGVPGAPPHVLGLLPWRSRAVPVVDLAERLGIEGAPLPRSAERILVARGAAGESFLAWPVHDELELRSFPLPHEPRPVDRPFVRAAFESERESLLVPDVASLLDPASAGPNGRSATAPT